MCALSARDLLNLWDAGSGRDNTTRALMMLHVAGFDGSSDGVADLSIGERDRCLFDLRKRVFGSRIEALERCPRCGARLEVTFDLADVQAVDDDVSCGPIALDAGDYNIELRTPSSRDLLAIRGSRDAAEARRGLLERCVVRITGSSPSSGPADLSRSLQDAIDMALAEHDPQAEVLLALQCVDCGHEWNTHFDIVEFLWSELDRAAQRLLREIHVIAKAYGWPESTILTLSPRRRSIYLGMVADD
jgi:hypothetical protein